jgi:hypothetical protein
MTKSRDDPYGPFGGVEDSSNTSDGKQPLLSDDDFMDSYKQFKNGYFSSWRSCIIS